MGNLNVNTPEDDPEVVVDEPSPSDESAPTEGQPEPGNDEGADSGKSTDDGIKTKETDKPEFKSFIQDMNALIKYRDEHPEFAPYVNKLLDTDKNMQKHFTQTMQRIPRHLRDADLIAIERDAKAWREFQAKGGQQTVKTEATPEVKPQAPTPQAQPDILADAIKRYEAKKGEPCTDEEKAFIEFQLQSIQSAIDNKIKPLTEKEQQRETEATWKGLENHNRFGYLDLSQFKPKAMEIKSKNPGLSIEDCLELVVARTPEFVDDKGRKFKTLDSYIASVQKEEELKKPVPPGKHNFVAGKGNSTQRGTSKYTQAEIDKMTAAEYKEKVLTPQQRGESVD